VPDNAEFDNGFKAKWEDFIRDVVAGRPHVYDFFAAARKIQLAEAGLKSSAEGRRRTRAPHRCE
jgi:predicted dehydrogenase